MAQGNNKVDMEYTLYVYYVLSCGTSPGILLVIEGVNQVDCIESLIIAYESKINIFEEIRYFLMFYLNLDFIIYWVLVLLILFNFSFLSMGLSFFQN